MGRASSILPRRVLVRAGSAPRPEPMPATIAPMLAVAASDLPSDPQQFNFEYKWDGVRAISFHYGDPKRFRLESRNQLYTTRRYPELHALSTALGKTPSILDGEIVFFAGSR